MNAQYGTYPGPDFRIFESRTHDDPPIYQQQNHAYVDVAISETFYPLWVFLLLAALFAHEETSYGA